MVDGKVRLFNHVVLNEGQRKSGYGGSYQLYQPPTVTYVVQKDSQFKEISKKSFNELKVLLSDCPTVVSKIDNKTYKFEDLESVIKEYNSCN